MDEETSLFQENIQSTSQEYSQNRNQDKKASSSTTDSSPSPSSVETSENIKEVESGTDK